MHDNYFPSIHCTPVYRHVINRAERKTFFFPPVCLLIKCLRHMYNAHRTQHVKIQKDRISLYLHIIIGIVGNVLVHHYSSKLLVDVSALS